MKSRDRDRRSLARPPRWVVEAIAFGVLALWGLWWSLIAVGWPLAAKLFPLSVGIALTVISVVLVVRTITNRNANGTELGPAAEISEREQETLRAIADEETLAAFEDESQVLDPREVARLVAWLLGFVALIVLLGFVAGLATAVFGYVLTEAKAGWRLAIVLGAVTAVYLYVLTGPVLHVPLPEPFVVNVVSSITGR